MLRIGDPQGTLRMDKRSAHKLMYLWRSEYKSHTCIFRNYSFWFSRARQKHSISYKCSSSSPKVESGTCVFASTVKFSAQSEWALSICMHSHHTFMPYIVCRVESFYFSIYFWTKLTQKDKFHFSLFFLASYALDRQQRTHDIHLHFFVASHTHTICLLRSAVFMCVYVRAFGVCYGDSLLFLKLKVKWEMHDCTMHKHRHRIQQQHRQHWRN